MSKHFSVQPKIPLDFCLKSKWIIFNINAEISQSDAELQELERRLKT